MIKDLHLKMYHQQIKIQIILIKKAFLLHTSLKISLKFYFIIQHFN